MAKDDVIKQFESLKGVGKSKAELLYDNGFKSMDKLQKATLEELKAIEGINEKLAKDIINQFPKEEKKEKPKEEKPKKEVTPKETKKESKPKSEPKKVEKPKEKAKPEVEETEYTVKKKPEIGKELNEKLRLRKKIKQRTPEFLREEWFRYKRVPKNWRRPDGITSKMRINLKYRPSKVRVGFRGPKETRGLHSSGFEEVIVHNVKEIQEINPKTQAARIGSTVGTKKRMEIEKKADELDIRILNR